MLIVINDERCQTCLTSQPLCISRNSCHALPLELLSLLLSLHALDGALPHVMLMAQGLQVTPIEGCTATKDRHYMVHLCSVRPTGGVLAGGVLGQDLGPECRPLCRESWVRGVCSPGAGVGRAPGCTRGAQHRAPRLGATGRGSSRHMLSVLIGI